MSLNGVARPGPSIPTLCMQALPPCCMRRQPQALRSRGVRVMSIAPGNVAGTAMAGETGKQGEAGRLGCGSCGAWRPAQRIPADVATPHALPPPLQPAARAG